MSLAVDETASDLPVKDVGLTRAGLMPSGPDRQRLFRVPRDHLEDQCLRLQEENAVLRQHAHTQEQRLRRMSTRLMRLQESRRGTEGFRERDMEDTIQDLETRKQLTEKSAALRVTQEKFRDLQEAIPCRTEGGAKANKVRPRRKKAKTSGRRGGKRRRRGRRRCFHLVAEERRRLQEEREGLREEQEALGGTERDVKRERRDLLHTELQHYQQQVTFLQSRLDSVTQVFDMSVEDLSETLLQIKAFRLQQESRRGLGFLEEVEGGGGGGDLGRVLGEVQAAHAETVLELHKTRELLLLENRINTGLQEELNTVNHKRETERQESRGRVGEKDKLLSKRALQINTLQAQLKELAYSPKNYKRSIPIQYTWPGGDQEVVQPIEDDTAFSQLRPGESMLEIHLKAATFTPGGLRTLGDQGRDQGRDPVTFCTYALLDYEVHCTPLVSGTRPAYGFTSRYALSARDLARLRGGGPDVREAGSKVRVELHQAVGGVRFSTLGSGAMGLAGALERRGERLAGSVNLTEPDRMTLRGPATQTGARQLFLGWQDITPGELFDYGGGIPNELVISVERCVGLSGRWPGLLPDAYMTYRFYDLPPHVSSTVQCCADPAFNDTVSYPLAVTADVLQYLSDDQVPPVYLAKTPAIMS
ncbi:hypothetical protein CRUP_036120 [Coryphaenoides rupestris]|nr:hypothetical protein CRUP_036120 [Coryphaenoides rupestris]